MPRGGVLADLVERAKDRAKEVILMARQCGLCGRPPARARALRAMLSNPSIIHLLAVGHRREIYRDL